MVNYTCSSVQLKTFNIKVLAIVLLEFLKYLILAFTLKDHACIFVCFSPFSSHRPNITVDQPPKYIMCLYCMIYFSYFPDIHFNTG